MPGGHPGLVVPGIRKKLKPKMLAKLALVCALFAGAIAADATTTTPPFPADGSSALSNKTKDNADLDW